jgi:predicted RNA binding protein YcfA (HicA-like mRNA interferase family)
VPRFGPVKRKDLIHFLRRAGFDGPYSGAKHQFMVKGDIVLHIPNPHASDVGRELLSRLLKQAQISREEWERL